jgi:8-oxo-dGTP pyrophosphatase MutT (NUDIX family)
LSSRVGKRQKLNRPKAKRVAVLAISTKKPGKILLVTSRNSKSWSLAKGHVEHSLGPVESARREAFEEAGVVGRLATASIGSYIHRNSAGAVFRVRVYKMHVQDELSSWPEKKERRRRWAPLKSALKLVSNTSLRRLIRTQFHARA